MSAELRKDRVIRSYVRRAGRMTDSQRKALAQLWPSFGIETGDSPLDLTKEFGREASRVLEIGFGDGENLVRAASDNPHQDYLGIEVHDPGMGHCLIRARELRVDNLKVISRDAIKVLENCLYEDSLERINLYFPDPWPKKRHHKRRIVNSTFLALAALKLQPGGTLRIATDWGNYAEHIDELLANDNAFDLVDRREHAGDQPLDRVTTRFEQRGLREGHSIVDWCFCKR